MDDFQKDLDEFMKPYGEKQLALHRKRLMQKSTELKSKRQRIVEKQNAFKLQLITISGGTISIFMALQQAESVAIPIKIGFSLLGASLVFGIASLYFDIDTDNTSTEFEEELNLQSAKMNLDFIEKFNHVDVKFDKEILTLQEKVISEMKTFSQNRRDNINKVLKMLHINGQIIEDGQLVLFLTGILSLVIGIFFNST